MSYKKAAVGRFFVGSAKIIKHNTVYLLVMYIYSIQRGFTLIELLVVIAIIGILASVVLTNVNQARSKGADAGIIQTINNMRAQAELYYDEALTYSGMCDDTSITTALARVAEFNGGATATCVDGDDVAGAWAIESVLVASSTEYYCVDHTGAAGRYGASTVSAAGNDADCG